MNSNSSGLKKTLHKINTHVMCYLLRYYVEIKCQLDATDEFLLQILLLAQHVSGTYMLSKQ
jgi:hypothetical protein